MTDPERYSIMVRKVHVDGEDLWRATVRELPDVAEFAATRDEAVALAHDAIIDLQDSAAEDNRPFPEPLEDDEEYSGRITLRLPKSLHRAIALKATEEDVSLNWYIVTNLAIGLSERAASVTQGTEIQPLWTYEPTKYFLQAAGTSPALSVVLMEDVDEPETSTWGPMLTQTTPGSLPYQATEKGDISARPRRRATARG